MEFFVSPDGLAANRLDGVSARRALDQLLQCNQIAVARIRRVLDAVAHGNHIRRLGLLEYRIIRSLSITDRGSKGIWGVTDICFPGGEVTGGGAGAWPGRRY